MDNLSYFNLLVENYPSEWGSASFSTLPQDLDGNTYTSWKEVYDNYLAFYKSRFETAPVDIFDQAILFIPIENIPDLLNKICILSEKMCSKDKMLWKLLWKRDIRSELPENIQTAALGGNIKDLYLHIVNDYNREDKSVQNKFYTAIEFGAINLLPRLIEQGADISADNFNALMLTAAFYQQDILKFLLSKIPNLRVIPDNLKEILCMDMISYFYIDSKGNCCASFFDNE